MGDQFLEVEIVEGILQGPVTVKDILALEMLEDIPLVPVMEDVILQQLLLVPQMEDIPMVKLLVADILLAPLLLLLVPQTADNILELGPLN